MLAKVLVNSRSNDRAHRLPRPLGVIRQSVPIGVGQPNSEGPGLLGLVPTAWPAGAIVRTNLHRTIDYLVVASLHGSSKTRIMRFTIPGVAHVPSLCIL